VAGMQAALDIASAGFKATLVERQSSLGGHAARLHQTFPTLEPAEKLVSDLADQVRAHPSIDVLN